MVSDRRQGLFIFNIVVILPGYTFLEVATGRLEEKYTIAELYRFEYVRSLSFTEEINLLVSQLLSSEHLVLVTGYKTDNIYMVNIADMKNPYIQRKFSNDFNPNVTNSIHASKTTTHNQRWVISQVESFHTQTKYWNIYDITGLEKLMPLSVIS